MSASDIASNRTAEEHAFLSRAASYNHLPDLIQSDTPSPTLRRTFSDLASQHQSESPPPPSKEDVAAGKDILRRTSLQSKDKSTIAVSRFTVSAEDVTDAPASASPPEPPPQVPMTRAPEPVARPSKARAMSGRLVSFARKPWASNSTDRPPSPSAKNSRLRPLRTEDSPPTAPMPPSRTSLQQESAAEQSAGSPVRKRTILSKRPRRPVVAVVTQSRDDSSSSPSSPSQQSLRAHPSLEKLPSSLNVSTPVLPPVPKGATTVSVDPPRKKDELWNAFRALEADFQKFQSKSSAFKANVVRASLIPFLSRHQSHPSLKGLRPEDLDRRVNILNKWWIGLLEMLNGKHNQSISGTDRPTYFDAVVGIMTRPEWRVPFPSPPSAETASWPLQPSATSVSESSASSGSDFLVESIHHNVRNIFTQNLLSQMAFVVDRMSMRHAPASLVAFCGKACAYAFFYCPGVADILVRLWNTSPNTFRQVLAQSRVDRRLDARTLTQDLALGFPPALRTLSCHTHTALVRYLRQKPDVPLNTAQIPWQSPWVSRWCGRDTDLFFVFVKYVHILYADTFAPDFAKDRRILAPGLLPIHAQVLVVLEDTLYKQSTPQAPDNAHTAAAITFDDFIEGADAAVSALPLGAANSHRSMAENRLIILLRDFLSESSQEPNHARLFFAESFCSIMKSAAQKISLFDHNACFLLCDLVEEVIPIITRYSQSVDHDLFDWDFWLEASRYMMQSHNSLTEVRVFSFLFAVWSTWTACEERKARLCLGVLLNESLFFHYFSHWSPMVRAYFQRLLCWRLGRFSGDPSPLDSTIYETLSHRLNRVWKYYLAFQNQAEDHFSAPLSSAPCTPAPGRRIIIIRCDNPLSPANLFVSFDRVVPPVPADTADSTGASSDKSDPSSDAPSSGRKKWEMFKSMFGGSSSRSGDNSPTSSSDESETTVPDTTVTADKCLDDHGRAPNSGDFPRPRTAHQPYSFKFSLEWMDRPQWPSKNKRLFTPCLPVGAQLHVQYRQSTSKADGDDMDTASESTTTTETDDEDDGMEEAYDEQTSTDPSSGTAPRALVSAKKQAILQESQIILKDTIVASKYAGRGLAEWAQIVSECDSFFARRRDEGVPCDRYVETPTLGVESFRK
ncbi:DUF1765-domain-containing protein [Aspergillus campestris IBT 28561]|uniref:DUF1765-domain-containing protein n=1 Tax=Aspergillus campestris (strain IBT 28561) TaxID=1392248 RepID=A0A2I1DE47_ASPC2|nr:DUF1765-domain-containing protein [Aspergillus campestris IBT 28561]PKY08153.1 DUF1765-domain-containing protein [Aspergillus campestris IBT 28561]